MKVNKSKPGEACGDMLKLDELDRFSIQKTDRGVEIRIAAVATNSGQVDDLCQLLRFMAREIG